SAYQSMKGHNMANHSSDSKAEKVTTWRRPHKLIVGLLALFVLVLAFGLGVHAGRFAGRFGPGVYGGLHQYGGYGAMHERGFGLGGGQLEAGPSRITGVVTTLNGQSFTLAG